MRAGPTKAGAGLSLLIAAVLLSLGLAACNRAQPRRFDFKGKVMGVDLRGRTVTVSHQTIPGYMEGMTMPFRLKDDRLLDSLAPGDKIQATLVVDREHSWLEDLVVIRESPDPRATTPALAEPNPGDEVPDFKLVNQDGKSIHLRQYRGRALVVTFIYTRCPLPDYCPLMNSYFSDIDKALRQDSALYAATHMISISVDPEYDTPRVLKRFGSTYGDDVFDRWEFASGSPDDVKRIAGYFGLEYWSDNGQIVHSLRTAVIDSGGRLVRVYRGNDWKPADVLADLKRLKSEKVDPPQAG
jgi:protein SCO1